MENMRWPNGRSKMLILRPIKGKQRLSSANNTENNMSLIEEIQTEVNLCQKKRPLTAESISVKKELDDSDNRKTANVVNQDLDQKSTIKSEQEDSIESQYLINHEEVDIKSEDDVEQSENRISAVEKPKYPQTNKKVAAHSAKPNATTELFKLKLKRKVKMLFGSKKNLVDKAFINKKRETPSELNVSLKRHPFTGETITVKREPDDFDNRETASEVDRDLDQKSTIKTEEENIINSQYLISHEEVDIKSEDDVEQSDSQVSTIETKRYQQSRKRVVAYSAWPNTTDELYKCNNCSYETPSKPHLKKHMLSHRLSSSYKILMEKGKKITVRHTPKDQIKIKCPHCPYQSKHENYIKNHLVLHKKPDEIVWHRCTECPYKTQWKYSLNKHAAIHNDPIEFFRCPHCTYKTTIKLSLESHVLRHANPDQLKWFMCQQCPFKTYRKHNLKPHMLIHKKDHAEWLQCTFCSFKTWRKSEFKRHQITHQDNNDGPGWHKCPECPYKTIYKSNLLVHAKRHNAADQTDWLQCPECSYRTPRKDFLKAHQMLHTAFVEWFHCFNCPYKTNWKPTLVRHMTDRHDRLAKTN